MYIHMYVRSGCKGYALGDRIDACYVLCGDECYVLGDRKSVMYLAQGKMHDPHSYARGARVMHLVIGIGSVEPALSTHVSISRYVWFPPTASQILKCCFRSRSLWSAGPLS